MAFNTHESISSKQMKIRLTWPTPFSHLLDVMAGSLHLRAEQMQRLEYCYKLYTKLMKLYQDVIGHSRRHLSVRTILLQGVVRYGTAALVGTAFVYSIS